MEILFSIVYGCVQGLTEFLPISSTGHLVILHTLWPLEVADDLGFDVVLHLGTFFALLWFFWGDIWRYARALFVSLRTRKIQSTDQRIAWLLLLGTIPAAALGLIFESYVEEQLRSLWVMVVTLALGAVLFFWIERVSRKERDLDGVNRVSAFSIGLAQAVALIPGVSRSGSTIITGLAFGLKREAAARFAFLLAVPITFGAGFKKTAELLQTGAVGEDWLVYVVGFTASLVSGYLCIKYFLRFLRQRSLRVFAWYRIALSILLVILLLSGVVSSM